MPEGNHAPKPTNSLVYLREMRCPTTWKLTMIEGGLAISRSRGLVNGVDKVVVSFVSCAYLGMHH